MKFSPYVQNLIASFRNLPDDFNSRKRIRKTFTINDLLESVTAKLNIGKHTAQDVLMANWQYVIGSDYAQRACPTKVEHGHTLTVKVHNPITRNELQFQSGQILNRLKTLPHCQKIKRVKFTAG